MTNSIPATSATMQTVILKVGLHCEGCERRVKKALHSVQGTASVDVDKNKERIMVTGFADPSKLLKAVKKTGKPVELWKYQNESNGNKNFYGPQHIVNTQQLANSTPSKASKGGAKGNSGNKTFQNFNSEDRSFHPQPEYLSGSEYEDPKFFGSKSDIQGDFKSPKKQMSEFYNSDLKPQKNQKSDYHGDIKPQKNHSSDFYGELKPQKNQNSGFYDDSKSPKNQKSDYYNDPKSPKNQKSDYYNDPKSPKNQKSDYYNDPKSSKNQKSDYYNDPKSQKNQKNQNFGIFKATKSQKSDLYSDAKPQKSEFYGEFKPVKASSDKFDVYGGFKSPKNQKPAKEKKPSYKVDTNSDYEGFSGSEDDSYFSSDNHKKKSDNSGYAQETSSGVYHNQQKHHDFRKSYGASTYNNEHTSGSSYGNEHIKSQQMVTSRFDNDQKSNSNQKKPKSHTAPKYVSFEDDYEQPKYRAEQPKHRAQPEGNHRRQDWDHDQKFYTTQQSYYPAYSYTYNDRIPPVNAGFTNMFSEENPNACSIM